MSAQRLSERSKRRIERATGLDLWRAWSFGGYTHEFVTTNHQHGWFHIKDNSWGFYPPEKVIHYTTCSERFPDA